MDNTVLVGLLGTLGTLVGALLGAWIGGKIQYKGAIDAIEKQIGKDEEKRTKEKQEKDTFINQVVTNYLLSEIEWNYNVLEISGSRNFPIEYRGILKFEEFRQAKYLLLENPNQLVREIIKLYDLFINIQAARTNKSDPGRIDLLNKILRQKRVIEALTS